MRELMMDCAGAPSPLHLTMRLLKSELLHLGFRLEGNDANDDNLQLKHPQSALHFVIKGLVLSKRLLVHGLAEEVCLFVI